MSADVLLTRIAELERRIRDVQSELDSVRTLAFSLTSVPYEPPAAEPPVARDPAPREPVMYPPPPPSAPPPPPRGPSLVDRLGEIDPAELLGARALAWAGGIVTLLGVVFFFVLAVNNGWIGPGIRVSLGAIASLLVFGAGLVVHRRYGNLQAALAAVGAGLAGGYATLLAATALYDLVPKPVALVLAAGIAAVGLAVSLRWDAEAVAGLGLVGAMAVPGMLVFQGGLTQIGVAFVAVVYAAAAVVAVRRGWLALLVVAAGVSVVQIGGLVAAAEDPGATVGVLAAIFFALYLAAESRGTSVAGSSAPTGSRRRSSSAAPPSPRSRAHGSSTRRCRRGSGSQPPQPWTARSRSCSSDALAGATLRRC